MLDIKSNAVETPAADASFDPYGRLLRMLMPSLRGVVVHDGYSNLVWASEEWDLGDEPRAHQRRHRERAGRYRGISRRRADHRRRPRRLLLRRARRAHRTAGCRQSDRAACRERNRSRARCSTVRQLVQPALECLRRELALRAKLGSSERDLDVRERDLELMMEISSNQSARSSDADEFSLILKTGLDRMGCALAALWVPDKNISRVPDAQRPARCRPNRCSVRSIT